MFVHFYEYFARVLHVFARVLHVFAQVLQVVAQIARKRATLAQKRAKVAKYANIRENHGFWRILTPDFEDVPISIPPPFVLL